jgi:hypothetical protein
VQKGRCITVANPRAGRLSLIWFGSTSFSLTNYLKHAIFASRLPGGAFEILVYGRSKMPRRAKMMTAKAKEKQRKIESGLVSELFPKVTEIAISMLYSQAGVLKPLSRTVNFSPDSAAAFKLNCLCADCVEGMFDFTKIISAMVGARKTTSKGEISCERCAAPECSYAAYTVTIKYGQ